VARTSTAIHLGVTTVGRILKEKPQPTPEQTANDEVTGQTDTPSSRPTARNTKRVVTAKYPNHVWHVDLTTVSILGGFWTSWLPFALPQCWPFCWWVAIVLDHYSRRCMGVAVFPTAPTSEAVCAFLGRAIHSAGRAPRYIVCDKGPQFWCPGFKRWCKRHKIKPPRYGAVGKHGSIAVIERFILTMKTLCTVHHHTPFSGLSLSGSPLWHADHLDRRQPLSKLIHDAFRACSFRHV
jgi:transposase InsO family protein